MKIFTWKQRIVVLLTTLGVAGIFLLAGFLIGKTVGNTTAGLIVAVLVSYPFTQFTLVKTLNRMHESPRKDAANTNAQQN